MTSAPKKKFAALISGRGSNMASLLAAAEKPDFHAEPTLVLSNKAEALESAAGSMVSRCGQRQMLLVLAALVTWTDGIEPVAPFFEL